MKRSASARSTTLSGAHATLRGSHRFALTRHEIEPIVFSCLTNTTESVTPVDSDSWSLDLVSATPSHSAVGVDWDSVVRVGVFVWVGLALLMRRRTSAECLEAGLIAVCE
jgi:hypothetical protein